MHTDNEVRTVPTLCGRASRGIASALCIFDLRYVLHFWNWELILFLMWSLIVSPVGGGAQELMVQGKQISAVLELLGSLGVPKRWIEVSDVTDKKKK
jgi:hypothetical protein